MQRNSYHKAFMKRILLLSLYICTYCGSLCAQGYNHDMGEDSLNSYESLADKLFKIEKKHDAFNVWLNYAASFQATDATDKWETRFANRDIRLEITGNITKHLSYRIRHQLNKSNKQLGGDNFAKATDLAWIGYQFNDKWSIQGGKICLNWGGFEYDENPLFIYRYSDFIDATDIFMAGVGISFQPIPSQEIVLQGTNTYNGSFSEEWGDHPVAVGREITDFAGLEKSRHPLTFIVNWNGNFFDNRLQTRWAWGVQQLAKGKTARLLTLGQQLNTPRLQWYLDYYGGWYDMDHLRYVNSDLSDWLQLPANEDSQLAILAADSEDGVSPVMSNVRYHSLVTKANWQFAPQWNIMLKGTYETVSAPRFHDFNNYRKAYVYAASLEYYPVKHQNLRVFLAYMGHTVDYSDRCGLKDKTTNRIELGFMYRMKCF